MGHDKGHKCLIEDDELSDTELPAKSEVVPSNPFGQCKESSSRGSSVMSGLSGPFGVTTPPTSPQSQQSDDSSHDVFIKAPFLHRGSSQKKKKSIKSSKSPMQKAASTMGDVFARAPFSGKKPWSKTRSPPSSQPASSVVSALFVNESGGGEGSIYAGGMYNMAVQPGCGSPPAAMDHYPSTSSPPITNQVSPPTVAMHSPSISPDLVPMQTQSPVAPPQQLDLFGSGNFADMTFREAHVQMARQDRLAGASQQPRSASQTSNAGSQPGSQQAITPGSRPASQGPPSLTTSPQPSMFQQHTSSPQPPASLHLASMPSPAEPPAPNLTTIKDFPIDAFPTAALPAVPLEVVRNSHSDAHMHHTSSGGVRKHGKTTPTHKSATLRRNSSDSRSSGSEKDTPKSKYFSKSSDLLQDENVEVLYTGETNYVGLKKHRRQKAKGPPTTEFANLGFMDDLAADEDDDGDDDDNEDDMCEEDTRTESVLNLSVDALKPSNMANFLTEGSHTLPRAGSKKHRIKPAAHDPFTVSKSSSIFK